MPKLHIAAAAAVVCSMVLFPARAPADDLQDALESALSSGDTAKVLSIMKDHKEPAEQAEFSHWLKQKVDNGQAPDQFASLMILTSLRERNFDDALMYLSYYRALLLIDGLACSDRSSPGSIFEGTIFLFGRLVNDPRFTMDQKRDSVDRAMKLDEATLPVRKKDPSLCGAGMTGYARDLHVQLPPPPKAEKLTGLYNDDPDWRQKRSAALPNLKTSLLTVVGVNQKP